MVDDDAEGEMPWKAMVNDGAHWKASSSSSSACQVHEPRWSLYQSHQLGKRGDEETFHGKAALLDESKYNSIRTTVDSLNSPDGSKIATGFCVVYSASKNTYFMLFERFHMRKAYEVFSLVGLWHETRSALLCSEDQQSQFAGKAKLLDSEQYGTTIAQAVDVLNYPYDQPDTEKCQRFTGDVGEAGICILFVESTRNYYIIYGDGREDDVAEKFNVKLQPVGSVATPATGMEPQDSHTSSLGGSQRLSTPSTLCRPARLSTLSCPSVSSKSPRPSLCSHSSLLSPTGSGPPLVPTPMSRSPSNFDVMKEKFRAMFAWGPRAAVAASSTQYDHKTFTPTYCRMLNSKYDVLRQIGSGAQGAAHLVKLIGAPCEEEAFFVAKETHDMTEAGVRDFLKEFERMRDLRHPNCLRVIEMFHYEARRQMFIIIEYARGGDLYHYMKTMIINEELLDESVIAKMMQQAMRGVAFLHAESIVHNDLKPENLLVMSEYAKGSAPRVVVADYGCATLDSSENGKIFFGDPRYMSPQAMESMMSYLEEQATIERSGPDVDVWAMGVTIYQFLGRGVLPFLYDEVTLKNLKGVFPKLKDALLGPDEVKFEFPEADGHDCQGATFSLEAQKLLKMMLHKDLSSRCKSAEIVDHPWFKIEPDGCPRNKSMEKLAAGIKFQATRNTVRQLLRNAIAAKLRYEHVDSCYKIFAKFDPDNSGSITKEEFLKAMEDRHAKGCHESRSRFSENAKEAFERADVDKNGSLEFNEFAAITLDWKALEGAVLEHHLMGVLDTFYEGIKEISIEQFSTRFQSVFGEIPQDELRRCIEKLDRDGDGIITLDELKHFVRMETRSFDCASFQPGIAEASTTSCEWILPVHSFGSSSEALSSRSLGVQPTLGQLSRSDS